MPELLDIRGEINEAFAESRVTMAALIRFRAGIRAAQSGFSLPDGTQERHFDQATENLEDTYLIRMWAVFEAAWVWFWRHKTGHSGEIKALHLIPWAEGVQEGHRSAADVTAEVDRVRLYRNFLIHGDHPTPRAPIEEAKRYLNRHLVKPPDHWPGADDD